MVEVGGGVALGDSMFAFNLELRAVAWETKPQKKKNLIFACIFKWQDVLLCCANQIEHAYVQNGDKKVKMLFSGPVS